MKVDSFFYRTRHYVGSGGEMVEVRPAREVQAMGCSRWVYRFENDQPWRIAPDKFTALLHASWELGKTGAAMNWTPCAPPSRNKPRLGFVELQLQRQAQS